MEKPDRTHTERHLSDLNLSPDRQSSQRVRKQCDYPNLNTYRSNP